MDINDMISHAFEAGTGMKRSSVARNPRFQELLDQTGEDAFVSAHERAEMLYLGERLADAAFRRLPINVRRSADAWANGEGEPSAHISTLYNTTTNWQQQRSPASRRQKTCADAALPNRYRFYGRSAIQPNCLGLAQAMVGYARAAGTEYVLVDTLRRYDVERTMGVYLGHMTNDMLLASHDVFSSVRKYRRDVAKQRALFQNDLNVILSAENYGLAHHALMIRCGDEKRWDLVDPYMYKYYGFELADEDYTVFNGEHRYDSTITYSFDPFAEYKFETLMTNAMAFVEHFENMIESRYHQTDYDNVIGLIDVASILVSSAAEEIRGNRKLLGTEDVIPFEIAPKAGVERRFFDEVFGPFMTSEEKELLAREDVAIAVAYGPALRRNQTKRRRNQAINRFLGLLLRYAYELQIHSYELLDIHPLIELNQAEYHLAAATVNHLAVMHGVNNSDMIRYRPYSQFMVRDTMTDVRDSSDDRIKDAHRCAMGRLRSMPTERVLPVLRSFL